MLIPIKAKIFWITSHLPCPTFFSPSWNKPPNKDRESSTQGGRFPPLCPPFRGYFKEREDHPERPRIFILNCRNPVKTFDCWVVRWWGLTIELSGGWVPCTRQDCGVNTVIHFIQLLPNYHLRPPEYCQRVQIHAGAVLSVCSPHCLAPALSVRPC